MEFGDHSISLIIPSWKDDELVLRLVDKIQKASFLKEIIVVSVAPKNEALKKCEEMGVKVIEVEHPNRGYQLHCGAKEARGAILVFHHADSELSERQLQAIQTCLEEKPRAVGGAFYRHFDERHEWLKKLEPLERFHSRWFGTLYGDQSIFIRSAVYRQIGGFRDVPLMEDIEFSKRLRRAGPIEMLDPPMISSPRHHLEKGAWKTSLRNGLFIFLFHCGMSPKMLHKWYYNEKGI